MPHDFRLYLAPLADFTDAPFRLICFEGGADFAYTEMTSAAALAHDHPKTLELLEKMPQEGPVGCQIFGANEKDMALAVQKIESLGERFCEINLNAGCPMQKVTRCGAGAELVKDPAKVEKLLRVIKENTRLPVSLKTRLGPNPSTVKIDELLGAAESAKAAKIIIHARFSSELHGGATHLDILAETAAKAKIPVIGNGSVKDAASLKAMLDTGVAGAMIGRAALGNPCIFAQLKAALEGKDDNPAAPSSQELFSRHIAYIIDFHRQLCENLPQARRTTLDMFAALKTRTHLLRYFSGVQGAAALRAKFNRVRSLADIWSIISGLGK